MADRASLAAQFDHFRRALDDRARSETFDAFHQQAYTLLTGPETRRAFDLGREDPRLRDRYGRNTWGQRCLLARRLVEAGVDLVTTSLDGPLCGRVGNWDDHAVNHHVFDAMKARCRYFDQAVSALIEDVHARGLDRRVLIVVTGEFGRTPKISYAKDQVSGVTQPGRDHWPRATSLIFSGGGIAGGQVIGATDRLGADVTRRRVGVRDFLATIYHHLGIDAGSITSARPDRPPDPRLAGRPGDPRAHRVGCSASTGPCPGFRDPCSECTLPASHATRGDGHLSVGFLGRSASSRLSAAAASGTPSGGSARSPSSSLAKSRSPLETPSTRTAVSSSRAASASLFLERRDEAGAQVGVVDVDRPLRHAGCLAVPLGGLAQPLVALGPAAEFFIVQVVTFIAARLHDTA